MLFLLIREHVVNLRDHKLVKNKLQKLVESSVELSATRQSQELHQRGKINYSIHQGDLKGQTIFRVVLLPFYKTTQMLRALFFHWNVILHCL